MAALVLVLFYTEQYPGFSGEWRPERFDDTLIERWQHHHDVIGLPGEGLLAIVGLVWVLSLASRRGRRLGLVLWSLLVLSLVIVEITPGDEEGIGRVVSGFLLLIGCALAAPGALLVTAFPVAWAWAAAFALVGVACALRRPWASWSFMPCCMGVASLQLVSDGVLTGTIG